jgi:hypothetical protein
VEQNYWRYLACLNNYREHGGKLLGIFGMSVIEGKWNRIIGNILTGLIN